MGGGCSTGMPHPVARSAQRKKPWSVPPGVRKAYSGLLPAAGKETTGDRGREAMEVTMDVMRWSSWTHPEQQTVDAG